MFDPAFALGAAFVWAFSPIYYRVFMQKLDFLSLNLLRNLMASIVLLFPAAYLGFGSGVGLSYAVISGVFTLVIGDSLFLLSVRETGASIAAPVVYTYVLMIQLAGVYLGQSVPASNFVAAVLVLLGVFILSRRQGGRPRGKGVALALGAGLGWTIGQEFIQAATNTGGNIVAITFARNATAAVALGAVFLLTRSSRKWPGGIPGKDYAFMSLFILSDLVLGSLLFVYSISTIGVAITVILTSLSPLLTQVFSHVLGKESPTRQDFIGGLLVVSAVILAIAY